MLEYILTDLKAFRKTHQDDSLGAMVVCDSSDQAKALFAEFEKIYGTQTQDYLNVAEEKAKYGNNDSLKASLILHDINDKEYRKEDVKSFKAGDIDILFVYNMLLTGFDAKRLKKLYLARVVKHQNLLQTLTRVNRPYKNYKFGYVVDFADISKEFKITNDNYFQELQSELGDEMQNYSNLFKTREEIQEDKSRIKEFLFQYDTRNAENFSDQIIQISDKKRLQDIINILSSAKELRNIIRLQGDDDLLNGIDFFKLNQLLKVVQDRLASINFVENLDNEDENNNLLNVALEDIYFQFVKVSEEEMIIAVQLHYDLRKTREELQRNIDQKDPEFITLREELERIFKNKNLDEVSQEDMRSNITLLKSVYARVNELNNKNSNINSKYNNDDKFTRIHKRIMEKGSISAKETQIHEALMDTKIMVDLLVLSNTNILKDGNDYFSDEVLSIIIQKFIDNKKMKLDFETTQNINQLVVNEYRQQSYIN